MQTGLHDGDPDVIIPEKNGHYQFGSSVREQCVDKNNQIIIKETTAEEGTVLEYVRLWYIMLDTLAIASSKAIISH